MSSQPHPKLTPQEYLALERVAEYKSEYYKGEMFAMSGATESHNIVNGNLFALIHNNRSPGRCRAFSHDMRVHVPATGLYTYPDVLVCCGKREWLDNTFDTLLNPTLIAEVLSESTEAYDRGKKFEHYQSIPSLQEYLLVSQDRAHVDLYTRQGDGTWLLRVASNLGDTVELRSIGCSIPLTALYEDAFPEATS